MIYISALKNEDSQTTYLLAISLWKRNRTWQSQSANLNHTNQQRGTVLSLSITVDWDSNFSERVVYPWFTKVQKQSLCFVCLESIFPTWISMTFDNILKSIFENALRKQKIKDIFYLCLVQGICLMTKPVKSWQILRKHFNCSLCSYTISLWQYTHWSYFLITNRYWISF